MLQLSAARNLATTEDTYLQIVRGKTAALFAAACEVGGVITGASKKEITALRDYGDALGSAFQIVDDLLDYRGEETATGKNIGDDFREGKLTLPLIKAIARADSAERNFWYRAIAKGKYDVSDLDRALGLLARHGAMEATRTDALAWANRARTALKPLPKNDLRQMFDDLADYVVARIT